MEGKEGLSEVAFRVVFSVCQNTSEEMDRWRGRVAIVTGASCGIGKAIAADLVRNGLRVVGLARQVQLVQELANELRGCSGELKPFLCDVRQTSQVNAVFEWIEQNWGAVHLIVNNAASLTLQPLNDIDVEAVKTIFDVNVVALTLFSKLALNSMKTNAVEEGYIININSYVGHLIFGHPGMAPYCASKNAVTVITESMRRELGASNNNIKVTSISPGLVGTGLTNDVVPDHLPRLNAQEVSDTVMYVISSPPGVNITELTVMKTGDVLF